MTTYVGMDKRGIARSGVIEHRNDVADRLERWFNQGWRWVKVTYNSQIIGEVTRNPDGNRTWWVEQ